MSSSSDNCPFCQCPKSSDPNFYACGTFHRPNKEPMRSAACEYIEEKRTLVSALKKIREACRNPGSMTKESPPGGLGWYCFATADDALRRTDHA